MNDILQEGSNPLLNLASKILIATQGPIINAFKEYHKSKAPNSYEFEECIRAFTDIPYFNELDKKKHFLSNDRFRERFNITNKEVVNKLMDEAYSQKYLLKIFSGLNPEYPIYNPRNFNIYGIKLAFDPSSMTTQEVLDRNGRLYAAFAFAILRPNKKEQKRNVPFIFRIRGNTIAKAYCLVMKPDKKHLYTLHPYELKCMNRMNPKLYTKNILIWSEDEIRKEMRG